MTLNDLQQFKCHKVVRAARIDAIREDSLDILVNKAFVEIQVGADWIQRHKPEPGGYFVVYADGYQSYSTPEAFESGYHALDLGNSSGSTPAPEPKSAFIEAWKKAEALAFDYAHSLPEGSERDQALQVYHRVRLVLSEGKSGMGGHGAAPATLTTDLPPHQLRVLEELAEIGTRLTKLVEFTGTELFASLPEAERDRLAKQANAMGEYVQILGERVAAF